MTSRIPRSWSVEIRRTHRQQSDRICHWLLQALAAYLHSSQVHGNSSLMTGLYKCIIHNMQSYSPMDEPSADSLFRCSARKTPYLSSNVSLESTMHRHAVVLYLTLACTAAPQFRTFSAGMPTNTFFFSCASVIPVENKGRK